MIADDPTAQLELQVASALEGVFDPEIPTLSIVDLGMVNGVSVVDRSVHVRMTPTFMGCPALEMIRRNVGRQLEAALPDVQVTVDFEYDPPWTTERITQAGREKLREFGIAPPVSGTARSKQVAATCPYCGSAHTRLENLFGPTACRSLFWCSACQQPFEAMKPV